MLDGLKALAIKKTMSILQDDVRARVEEKIDLFRNLEPADVQDDSKYIAIVVDPLWLYVRLQSGGSIEAVQKLTDFDIEGRFRKGLLQVRNDLVKVEDGKVALDPAFLAKVGPTLAEAFRA